MDLFQHVVHDRWCVRDGSWHSYTGVKILNEHLVLGVFGTIGAAAYFATRGEKKPEAQKPAPQLNASSPCVPDKDEADRRDEEAFIKQFLSEAQKEDK